MLSRRGFVAAGGSIALVAGTTASAAAQAGLEMFGGSLPGFSRDQFASLIDTRFSGHLDGRQYNFQLLKIEAGPVTSDVDQFRLLFRASSTDLPEANYQIVHELDGRLHGQLLRMEATGTDLPADVYSSGFSLLAQG